MRRLFISDLHLQPERPEITEALCYFLEEIAPGADELYLLGDIFELWLGDDHPSSVVDQIAPLLQNLRRSTAIYLMHGNRDFLIGQKGADLMSAELLPSEVELDLPQGKAILLHGDELCTDDHDYQALRRQLRSPDWQQQFLAKPITERIAIARQLRDASQTANATKSEAIMDVNLDSVAKVFDQKTPDLLIHGHTHRPKIHAEEADRGIGKRIVLGDWHSDGWYLISDSDRFELVNFVPFAHKDK